MSPVRRGALVAEFVGTAILLVAVVGSGIASNDAGSASAQLLAHSLVIGLTLVGLVAAFIGTSGAHFNPAVTLADALLGGRRLADVGPYVAAQTAGAIVGVVVANVLFSLDAVALSDKVRAGPALVGSEAFATFVLVLVIFAVVRGGQVALLPLVVGATVAAMIFATPSTALMNPAVTVARILTDTWTGVRLIDAIPFLAAQFGGALLAVAVLRATSPDLPIADSGETSADEPDDMPLAVEAVEPMTARQRFRHSHHAERALTLPRPTWRGRSHRIAAAVSVPVGIWLTVAAPAGASRVAAGMFAVGVFAMFAASGLNHLRPWSLHTTEVMVRVDHTGIYLTIIGTATAIAVLGMPPGAAQITMWVAWVASALGILVVWLPFATPRGLNNGIYLTIGWGSVLAMPVLYRHSGLASVLLLLLGGIFYTVGVVIVSKQRPDPNPDVFGYHEIWHLLVIAAVIVHYIDVAFVLL